MASFCQQCSIDVFGEDYGDFEGCVPEGHLRLSICEGCGFNAVLDHEGKCVSRDCLKKHGEVSLIPNEACSKE